MHALRYYISALSAYAMEECRAKPEGDVPSVATFAPTVMVVNLTCSSTTDTEAYDIVQDMVFGRPFHGILEFFGKNPDQTEPRGPAPIGERLFRARLELMTALASAKHGGDLGLRDRLHQEVAGMNVDNFHCPRTSALCRDVPGP